jgi:hypothetical protein
MFSMARYLLVAMGEVGAQARLDVLAVPVRIVALMLAAPLGLQWVAWAVVLGMLFRSGLTYFYLAQFTGLTLADLLGAVRRSALVTAACLAGPVALLVWQPQGAAQLAAASVAGLALWLAAILLFRHELAPECTLAGRKAWSLLTKSPQRMAYASGNPVISDAVPARGRPADTGALDHRGLAGTGYSSHAGGIGRPQPAAHRQLRCDPCVFRD